MDCNVIAVSIVTYRSTRLIVRLVKSVQKAKLMVWINIFIYQNKSKDHGATVSFWNIVDQGSHKSFSLTGERSSGHDFYIIWQVRRPEFVSLIKVLEDALRALSVVLQGKYVSAIQVIELIESE